MGSHIKPWRDSTNEERLDGQNGLLLTPSVDHLFDRGFISFKGNGDLLISPVADAVFLSAAAQNEVEGTFSAPRTHPCCGSLGPSAQAPSWSSRV